MKKIKMYADTILLSVLFVAILLMATAATPGGDPPIVPIMDTNSVAALPALPSTGIGIADQLLGAFTVKYGWAVSLITWLYTLGLIFKPLSEAAHRIVEATPSQRDDVILAKMEASRAYKAICYAVDYLLRIKIGTQRPIPPVAGK